MAEAYENTFDTEPADEEWENLMQLETARRKQQQVSRIQHLRERAGEEIKAQAKQQVKQQAKKLAARAAKALTKAIFQAIMQGLRMIVVFLVATPPGWVVDVCILAMILAIIVVSNPGGFVDFVTKGLTDPCSGGMIGQITGKGDPLCNAGIKILPWGSGGKTIWEKPF